MDGVPKSLNVEYYAQIIKEKALLRRLILSSARIISASYEQKEDADDAPQRGPGRRSSTSPSSGPRPGFIPVSQLTQPTIDMIAEFVDRREAVTGVPTGFRLTWTTSRRASTNRSWSSSPPGRRWARPPSA